MRKNISSGTVWESFAGYSRAVRLDDTVYVAGTTATDNDGNVVGIGDATAQTRFILEKVERALIEAGASLNDVVRTRIYLTDISQWEGVAREHGRVFENIRPANTLIVISALIGEEYLVEIEAEARISNTS